MRVADRPVRVGVIGAAYATLTHLPTYTALPETQLVAVATSRERTARDVAERFGAERAYGDYAEMCRADDLDLVAVVTRPSLHRSMALAALRAGKHVLCEAPLAATVAEGEEMARVARESGRIAVTGMQSRFSPGLWELRHRVAEGWLGRVENVSARAFYPTFAQPAATAPLWCADAANGASSPRVHGLHTADLIAWLFGDGRIATSAGRAATLRPTWPAENGPVAATSADSATLTGHLPGGALYSIHTCWTAWHGAGWTLEAYGDHGHIRAHAAGHTGHHPVTLTGARAAEPGPPREIPPRPDAYDVSELAPDSPAYPLARLVRRLARAIVSGTVDPDLPTFDDALARLRLAERLEVGER